MVAVGRDSSFFAFWKLGQHARPGRAPPSSRTPRAKMFARAFVDIAHSATARSRSTTASIWNKQHPLSELVVLSRRIEVEHEFLHTWMGSSKRVRLHGTFTVSRLRFAAGSCQSMFDQTKSSSSFRRPRFSTSHRTRWTSSRFENGLWNRISGDDVQTELAILPQLARRKSERKRGLPAEAERALAATTRRAHSHAPQPLRLIFTGRVKKDSGMRDR